MFDAIEFEHVDDPLRIVRHPLARHLGTRVSSAPQRDETASEYREHRRADNAATMLELRAYVARERNAR